MQLAGFLRQVGQGSFGADFQIGWWHDGFHAANHQGTLATPW